MSRDPEKARARKRRYLERLKVAKYGPTAINADMRGRHGKHARGAANGRWNGGLFWQSDGYLAVGVPEGHPLRQAHGYAYVHRLVAEEKIGRRLSPNEAGHHLNGDRTDNRPENLEVVTRSEHARRHADSDCRDERGRFVAGRARQ